MSKITIEVPRHGWRQENMGIPGSTRCFTVAQGHAESEPLERPGKDGLWKLGVVFDLAPALFWQRKGMAWKEELHFQFENGEVAIAKDAMWLKRDEECDAWIEWTYARGPLDKLVQLV